MLGVDMARWGGEGRFSGFASKSRAGLYLGGPGRYAAAARTG